MRSRARSMRRPAWLPVATRPAIDAHVLDLRIFGRGQRMEAQTSFRIARVDTVENERMEVDVQVQRIAEALHEGDGAALHRAPVPGEARPPPQRGEDGAHEEAEHRTRERAVEGQAVAQSEGQREHPLPYGDLGQHAVHQLRRGVGHAAPPARGTEPPALAREGDDALGGAGSAAQAHEAVGQDPAGEERPKLAFDEARHGPVSSPGVREEAFELGLHRAVEDALFGAAAGVDAPLRTARRGARVAK